MKQGLLLFALSCICPIAYPQERIDTLYYDKAGRGIINPLFADFRRITYCPADTLSPKAFRDFFISGEIHREGNFQTIDSLNDQNTRFDGKITTYFKNGGIEEIAHYTNGQLNGEYRLYYESGSPAIETIYIQGKLDGAHKEFEPNGICKLVEYRAGKPILDYYLLINPNGDTIKYRLADNTPIWESPAIQERIIDYRDGTAWQVYVKNGITLELTNSVVKDYGKWHKIDLIISNNSLTPIEFTPETDITAYSVDTKEVISNLDIWSCDAYIKKVKRSQTWASIAVAFSNAGAGYSTSSTSGYSQQGGYFHATTTTYNAAAAALAAQRLSDFNQAQQNEKEAKQMGYLKKNTIYPGESISGFAHIARIPGKRVVFVINIEGAEYIYEWGFDKKTAFLLIQ